MIYERRKADINIFQIQNLSRSTNTPTPPYLSEVVQVLLVGEEEDLVRAGDGAGLQDLTGTRHRHPI